MPCAGRRSDTGPSYRLPAGRFLSAAFFMLLALAPQPLSADLAPDAEASSHILVGAQPNQGFEVTCEDSVLYMDPVFADELGIMEFRVEGRFGPHPNTVCIRIPGPPEISEAYVADVCDLTALVRWTTDRPATSLVEYGLDPSCGLSTVPDPSLVVSHEVGITELSPETTYHYRVLSTDAFGNTSVGAVGSFTSLPLAPQITGLASENVGPTSFEAVWTTSEPCDSRVEYGPSVEYGEATDVSPEMVTAHRVRVEGLSPSTTYHFRALSVDGLDRVIRSDDGVVTTLDSGLVMTEAAVTDTSSSGAVVEWLTTRPSTSWVLYGETEAYGSVAGSDSLTRRHRVVLRGLDPYTEYVLKAVSTDSDGTTVESEQLGFSTSCDPLQMSEPHVAATSLTSVTLSWTTNSPARAMVEFGSDEGYGQCAPGDTGLALAHSVEVDGLEPGTVYHMRAVSTDAFGCVASSADLAVQTDTPQLAVLSPSVEETTATWASVAWLTTNAARCWIEYGTTQDCGFQTEQEPFHLVEHSAVLGDLAPRTLYHLRIHAVDHYGQTSVSEDLTFVTASHDGPAGLIVYGVVARQVSPTHALICWQTNVPASSMVRFGLSESCESSISSSEEVESHCVTLTGLTPDTRYYYTVSSEAAGGLSAESRLYSFRTPLEDLLPPEAPTGVTAAPSSGGIRVAWQTGDEYDLAAYRVYRRRHGSDSATALCELSAQASSYLDGDVLGGWEYEYSLSALDSSGNESALSPFVSATAGTGGRARAWVYPNPVTRGETTISFSPPDGAPARFAVDIYDARGRLVRSLGRGRAGDGISSVTWDAKDGSNSPVSSGIYFCVVSFSEGSVRSKIMVVR